MVTTGGIAAVLPYSARGCFAGRARPGYLLVPAVVCAPCSRPAGRRTEWCVPLSPAASCLVPGRAGTDTRISAAVPCLTAGDGTTAI